MCRCCPARWSPCSTQSPRRSGSMPRPGPAGIPGAWPDASGPPRGAWAQRVGPTGRGIGLEQDPAMLERALANLAGLPVTLTHANFDQLTGVLSSVGLVEVDGLLADLGFASDQVDAAERGLSFQQD